VNSIDKIGIVGSSGNLGTRLVVQACMAFSEVWTFDNNPQPLNIDVRGVDEAVQQLSMKTVPNIAASIGQIVEISDFVHWVAPLSATAELEDFPAGKLLILHDSVMEHSLDAADRLRQNAGFAGKIAIVHCIMNERRKVAIAEESEEIQKVVAHIQDLELVPKIKSANEHDHIMSVSQLPMAILHDLLADELAEYEAEGMLTPSGKDLMTALNARAAKWTATTLDTLLHNPHAIELINRMLEKTNGRKRL
jgi:hypothetical protein